MSNTILLIRHGHRDTSMGRELDNGLSLKGQHQVQRLANYLFHHHLTYPPDSIVSSPALRCTESVEPLSSLYQLSYTIDPRLREKAEGENNKAFKKRIEEVLAGVSTAGVHLLCSHGDWIPAASELLIGIAIDLKKGGLIEISEQAGTYSLRNCIQQFSFLPDTHISK